MSPPPFLNHPQWPSFTDPTGPCVICPWLPSQPPAHPHPTCAQQDYTLLLSLGSCSLRCFLLHLETNNFSASTQGHFLSEISPYQYQQRRSSLKFQDPDLALAFHLPSLLLLLPGVVLVFFLHSIVEATFHSFLQPQSLAPRGHLIHVL